MRTTTGDNVSKEQRILLRSASTLAQKEKVGLQRKRRDIKRDRQRGLRYDREVKHETNEHFLVAPEDDKLQIDGIVDRRIKAHAVEQMFRDAVLTDDNIFIQLANVPHLKNCMAPQQIDEICNMIFEDYDRGEDVHKILMTAVFVCGWLEATTTTNDYDHAVIRYESRVSYRHWDLDTSDIAPLGEVTSETAMHWGVRASIRRRI